MKNKHMALLTFVFVLFSTALSGIAVTASSPIESVGAGDHPPIRIIGNDQFTPENGVTGGSGTVNDPYIIENWVIVSNGSASQGIFINDTDVYFIIRNCTISGFHSSDEYRQGIQLSVVTHGKIENTTVSKCEIGIWIRYSPENKIISCTCSDYPFTNGYGIDIDHSTNITIISSTCYNTYIGIVIYCTTDIMVQKSECYNNTYLGLTVFSDESATLRFLIENCLFQNNEWGGIDITRYGRHPSCATIRNCSFYSNGLEPVPGAYLEGLALRRLCNSTIDNCVFNHNGLGLYIDERSENNSVRNCSFLSQITDGVQISGAPITRSYARNNEVSYCNFFNNDVGLNIGFTRTKAHHCTIANNSYAGVFSFPLSASQITWNNILDNGRDASWPDAAGVIIGLSFLDLRHNWWGSSQGPNVSLLAGYKNWWKIVPLRSTDNGDLVLLRHGFARLHPWLSAPVPNAGRQTG
jgi:parallel beta-helix repeat protein